MLKQIQSILDKEKFESTLLHASKEGFPYDRILLFLGTDSKKREQLLEITAQEQILKSSEQTSPADHPAKKYFRTQFRHVFPFSVEEMALGQIASLIAFLNQTSDFPGFELNELNNEVSFRYVWLTKGSAVDTTLIVSMIGIIQMVLTLFGQSIERVANGGTTFNELLKEVINMTDEAKKAKDSM
jgi:hypothetical protein